MKKLVRVSKSREKDLPVAPATLYKWHHLKKYPEIFKKFGGFLFIDIDALEAVINQAKG